MELTSPQGGLEDLDACVQLCDKAAQLADGHRVSPLEALDAGLMQSLLQSGDINGVH